MFLLWAVLGLGGLASCDKYVDDLQGIGKRVEVLESKNLTSLTENLHTIQLLIKATEEKDYFTTFKDNGDGTYTVTLASDPQHPITFQSAKDGVNGKNATEVVIGVREVEGLWFWTVNGQLTEMRANPTAGKNGTDYNGDPHDINVPLLKVGEAGYWMISIDGGDTWKMVYNGNNLVYANGKDGEPDKMIQTVTLSADGTSVTIVLVDGTIITFPVHQ